MPPLSIAGLEFESRKDAWHASRPFPFLPTRDSSDSNLIHLRLEGSEVTASQRRALESFLQNEAAICRSILETTVRYLKAVRRIHPAWYEDIPDVNSLDQIASMLELCSLNVMRVEHDGFAFLGFAFHCDWDQEHGFGIAVHEADVIDIGHRNVSFEPGGLCTTMYPGALNEAQREKSQRIFGKAISAGMAEMTRHFQQIKEKEEATLNNAIKSNQAGTALQELTRLILKDRYRTLRLTIDLPPDAPRSIDDRSMRMVLQARLAVAAQQMSDFGNLNMDAAAADIEKKLSEKPSPEVVVSFTLGGEEARWHYTSHPTFVSRIAAGEWPDVLFRMKAEWPGAKPRLDSIAVLKMERVGLFTKQTSDKPDLKTPLLPAAVAAIAEVFKVDRAANK